MEPVENTDVGVLQPRMLTVGEVMAMPRQERRRLMKQYHSPNMMPGSVAPIRYVGKKKRR